jgi:tRNA 2-selenouridine synthase
MDYSKFLYIPVLGLTGSGKTKLLNDLENNGGQVICVEEIAGVKGVCLRNLFDDHEMTKEEFEAAFAHRFATFEPAKPVWVEWKPLEAHRLSLPVQFVAAVRSVPAWILVEDFESRVNKLMSDYVDLHDHLDYITSGFQSGNVLPQHHLSMLRGFEVSADPLGMVRYLLAVYYDPMYMAEIKRFPSIAYGSCGENGLIEFEGVMTQNPTNDDYRKVASLVLEPE